MGVKSILVCDCCGSEIKESRDHYDIHKVRKGNQIIFESPRFTDAAGSMDSNTISLDLCRECCNRGIRALEAIARNCEED